MNSFVNIPEEFLNKWQEIADLLAKIFHIPAALIMKIESEFMEVFVSSRSENNPYQPGDKEKWDGLYYNPELLIKKTNYYQFTNIKKQLVKAFTLSEHRIGSCVGSQGVVLS